MRRFAVIGALVALGASGAHEAGATSFRRPFNEGYALSYGFDHDGSSGNNSCQDYACGGTCYDGHKGSDLPTPYGTTIVATADGTVTFVSSGCADVGFIGSQCGGGYGNYVRIQHADGKVTYHAHLKDGSIAVGVNQGVTCGQKVGESASSGNSSGNHQHFEVRVGSADDPYQGQCGGPVSYWVQQNGYGQAVGTGCELSNCVCSPGATETQGCGLCGTQSRTCDAACQWGGWGGCGGEGPCSPGQVEKQPCGSCGEQERSCDGACQWGGWGECGPPPCMPGESQTQACGNCGTQTRSCDPICQWAAFDACTGEGACSPGQSDTQPCGDCGQTTRACQNDCSWAGFGDCAGPDPDGGNTPCDTGLPAVCADGRVRCVGGQTSCNAVMSAAETCNGVDDDCNGSADDGHPETLGAPPPAFAAKLVDASYPLAMEAGGRAQAWADFTNVGASSWPVGRVWLKALGADGAASVLYEQGIWPAFDVAAVLDRDTEPGETGRFAFAIAAPSAAGDVRETFVLQDPEGGALSCPRPDLEVAIAVLPGKEGAEPGGAADEAVEVESGCATAPAREGKWGVWLVAAAMGLARWRARRG